MFGMQWLKGLKTHRRLRSLFADAARVVAMEEGLKTLSNSELKARFQALREGVTLSFESPQKESAEVVLEGFALVRESARRHLFMSHYPEQIMAGLSLFRGEVIEMGTGEGKTLAATLPAAVVALMGRGVHIVSVNDYLTARDADWMRPCYEALGLSVDCVVSGKPREAVKAAYHADITYVTNHELGFDYLRDHLVYERAQVVQRPPFFAIVDEADSVLIDEARTPLSISGEVTQDRDLYETMHQLSHRLDAQEFVEKEFSPLDALSQKEEVEDSGDFMVNKAAHTVEMTDRGLLKAEGLFREATLLKADEDLYQPDKLYLIHYLTSALKAKYLLQRDVDYLVQNRSIVLIDPNTGRPAAGRRLGDGLHQALEVKEGVPVQNESFTLATISFQNHFRMYPRLSGMTGTATTEAEELRDIYGLLVQVIPPHKPSLRADKNDVIYVTSEMRYQAIMTEVKEAHQRGQPVLLGTISVASSQNLSEVLTKEGVPHEVLNAKNHAMEAEIIAQAGRLSAVTVVTNMAGRGVDIVLGGAFSPPPDTTDLERARLKEAWQVAHDAVVALGGLKIIGVERHESRRIDNQLRGRSGRQGDPGESRFYLSLEDDLFRIFAGGRFRDWMNRMHLDPSVPLEMKMITRTIEKAQRAIEGQNYDMRKALVETDNVLHEQRGVIYKDREHFLFSEDIHKDIVAMAHAHLDECLKEMVGTPTALDHIDLDMLSKALKRDFYMEAPDIKAYLARHDERFSWESFSDFLHEGLEKVLQAISQKLPSEMLSQIESQMVLQALDSHFRTHITELQTLRQAIAFRNFGQKDPRQQYKIEAFDAFNKMVDKLWRFFFARYCHMVSQEIRVEYVNEEGEKVAQHEERLAPPALPAVTPNAAPSTASSAAPAPAPIRTMKKVGRNELCPCGSGKKYKQCHGR